MEHEFFCLGRLGSPGSKGKKVYLSFSEQLLRVVLWAKKIPKIFQKFFSNRTKKLHKKAFINFCFYRGFFRDNKPERDFGLQVRDGDFIEFEFKTRSYSYSLFTHFAFKGRDSTKLEIMSLMSFHWFSILFKMILKSWLTFTANDRNLKFIEWISAFYFYAPWMTSLNLI